MIPSSVTTASSSTSCGARGDALQFLARVGEADEQRRMPEAAPAPEREHAIIEAAASAEPHAAAVEAHQRQEHQIEPARSDDAGPALRLGDPQAVGPQRAVHLDEAHGARGTPPVDARQVDPATALLGQLDQRGAVELRRQGGVECNARAGGEVQRTVGITGDEARGAAALGGTDGAAPGLERRPQSAAGDANGRIRQRHPHVPVRTVALEPEQQVGHAATGKAFRSKCGPAQCCRKHRVPRVFQLGSEVTRSACRTPQATPATTVHQACAPCL